MNVIINRAGKIMRSLPSVELVRRVATGETVITVGRFYSSIVQNLTNRVIELSGRLRSLTSYTNRYPNSFMGKAILSHNSNVKR